MSFSLALFVSGHCACTGQYSEAPAQATSAKVSSAIAGYSLPLPSLQVPQMSHLEAGRYLFGMMSQQRERIEGKETVSEREALVRRILVTKEPCKEGAYQVGKS